VGAIFFTETLTTPSRTFSNFGDSQFFVGVTASNAAGSTSASNQGSILLVSNYVSQTIFVTPTNYIIEEMGQYPPFAGTFGSADAADYHMTYIASNFGGLIDAWDGTHIVFHALLTTELVDLPERAGLSNAEFVNVNGDVVARDREELYSGAHLAPILTPQGNQVTGPVWTGANADGTWSGLTANNWTRRHGWTATVGNAAGPGNTTWLSNGTRAGNLAARLYGVGIRDTPFPGNIPQPTVTAPIVDQVVSVGALFNIDVENAFDNGREYYFRQASGLPLPAWLTNDFRTSVLSGTPTAADAGTITIEVTALEPRNTLVAIDQFELTVTA
jgi:hypothetical protein